MVSISARLSAFVTLELAISGSGALPIPAAFESVGYELGLFLCFVSTLLNTATTLWLLEAAVDSRTGRCASSFSSLGERAGFGPGFKIAVEIATLLLMFGSYAACLAAFGETSARAVVVVFRAPISIVRTIRLIAPGFGIMISAILGNRDYSHLFIFSVIGVIFLIGLVSAVVIAFFLYGTASVETQTDFAIIKNIPQSLTTLNYSLYLAPFALSMLANLSHHEDATELKLVVRDACIAAFFVTFCLYSLLGVYGCLWKGPNTPGDIATAFSDGIIAPVTTLYLMVSLLPMYHPLEDSVRGMLILITKPSRSPTDASPRFTSRRPPSNKSVKICTLSLLILAGLLARSSSNILFSLTGATGVAITCYVVPVLCYWRLHSSFDIVPPTSLRLLATKSKHTTEQEAIPLAVSGSFCQPLPRKWWTSWKTTRPVLLDIFLPFIALAFGLIISSFSLFLYL